MCAHLLRLAYLGGGGVTTLPPNDSEQPYPSTCASYAFYTLAGARGLQ